MAADRSTKTETPTSTAPVPLRDLKIEYRPLAKLVPFARNARTAPKAKPKRGA